ncbi:MAG: selenide, water dikinase SelD [Comamonadaceae bacterium]|nr:selenide, water dikinase SelD [Comamonadaceae bacterium]
MQTPSTPIARDIVLIGGGHSHVGVLKRWGMQHEPGVRLTVICTDVHTPYSGMLPGYISGHYSYDDVHIDLARLAVFAGARLYCDEVTGIDRAAQKVLCRNRPPVPYDFLSINIGSTPRLTGVAGAAAHATPVKPITRFNARWLALLARVQQHTQGLLRVAVVGAGAGGVKLILSMQYRLRQELQSRGQNPDLLEFHILSSADCVLPTHNARVRHKFASVLAERGVQVHLNSNVVQVQPGQLLCANGAAVAADEIMWVTQAGGAPWLQSTGLALNDGGFIRVNEQLQSVSDARIFAAGDIVAMDQHPLEKAGVFAVRMGPPLADNLRLSVQGRALKTYRPQSSWLALISTGDKYAVASRGGLGFWGAWVWRWKDQIDRGFMRKFAELPTMQAQPQATPLSQLALTADESWQATAALSMRCGGCGAKVGTTVLSSALAQLQVMQCPDVLIGLHDPDDAAVVWVPPGKAMVHSVDFFRAFVDDPYLFGKVAANHALGDIFAMGAEPQSATAIATVPPGLEAKVEDLLFQMMSGAVEVLNEAGCALVGGHTGEGSELALGFAVNGLLDESLVGVTRKGGMHPGDVLILTKPIGTGTLFAAHARLAAKGRWIDAALQSMVLSNRLGAQCLREFGATACTDLTGFGLLGHLVEMIKPSGVDAELALSNLPLLEGALETVAAGIVSSLQPANVRLLRALRNQEQFVNHPRYPLIFDPQTAGGLLASVPSAQADACVAALQALGYAHAAIIGRILAQGDAPEPIVLLP